MVTRRNMLKQLSAASLGLASFQRFGGKVFSDPAPKNLPDYLTKPEAIEQAATKARPLLGGTVPEDFYKRLGATHYAGKYCLTEKPFLLEGCEALRNFGFGTCKLWFENFLPGYGFHSDWSSLNPAGTLVDIAKHPYFQAAFEIPFGTFVLENRTVRGKNKNIYDADNSFEEDEKQCEELTQYLYETYSDREITFILQQWEGDWLFRQNYAPDWTLERQVAEKRSDVFRRWFTARQNGVLKGRDVAGQGKKCRVLFAVEVNRVLDLMQGIPTLTELVLPNMETDLVSWSAYDGLDNVVDCWHGIELIRHFSKPTGFFGKPVVYIGEIGRPEQELKKTDLTQWWDRFMGVFLAQEIPWILHWELYCNELTEEAKKKPVPDNGIYSAEDLRGFWLLRPDGTPSIAAEYFKRLLIPA